MNGLAFNYTPLKEILRDKGYIRGPFGSALRRGEMKNNGIPVYEQQHAIYNIREFRYFIDNEKYNELKRFKVEENDLIISCSGTVGKISIISKEDPKGIISQALLLLRTNNDVILTKFLFYFLTSYVGYNQLINASHGSVQLNIAPREVVEQIEIPTPVISIQKKIVHILSNLDFKIDLLRRQNRTFENIAQTLFRRWFVDFEFPDKNGIPYKSSGGKMVKSELGKIPEGWRVGKLGEFVGIKHGFAFKGKSITTEETEQILLTPGNFKIGGGFNDSKFKYYCDTDYPTEYILDAKDLIITMTDLSKEGDTLGYPAFLPEIKDKRLLHNQRLGKIENNLLDKTFLYYLMSRREYRAHVLGGASGTTVRHTSPSRICNYEFVIPRDQLTDIFARIANRMIDKILLNSNQISTLTKTRDILLPKLMSGQIRVKDL